jgi:hypothetical protein
MQIWNSIEWKNKQNVIIKSIIWKTIIDIFLVEKKIDITSYLTSVTIKWKNILIKTNKPIINTELLIIHDIIKNKIIEKLKKLWIKFYDFEIKYF